LIVLFDDNQVSIDGPTSLAVSDDQAMRFEASGWATLRVDGHDPDVIAGAIELARRSDRPTLIVCRTVIGYGAPTKQGTASTHGSPLGPEEVAAARGRLGWGYAPFEVPPHVLSAWRACGARGAVPHEAWTERWQSLDAEVRAAVEHPARAAAPAIAAAIAAAKKAAAGATVKRATRAWSEATLEHLIPALPALIGGSADLTGSNNTRVKGQAVVSAGSFAGSYLHYGVREHAMAAVMNGMALHGGLIPYGGTFLVFSDYCRPAIRLSALMRQRVVYVMTHDSIGLGEDGPTHQPVEHLAALRAIPNLNVFRPADGVETAECWELAVRPGETPSVLALTRQAVPNLRTAHTDENLCAKGAYVLAETPGRKRDITLLATGSEVGIAMEARALLAGHGIEAAVVSMPCWELFAAQPAAYREAVLGSAPRVAVEAAVGFGWERWLGERGAFVGMGGFGASAPAAPLYEHFGMTPAAVAAAARKLVES
ncbi:MAG TPA: transketolase, partial [Hyphomicrobiaceae bacterium]